MLLVRQKDNKPEKALSVSVQTPEMAFLLILQCQVQSLDSQGQPSTNLQSQSSRLRTTPDLWRHEGFLHSVRQLPEAKINSLLG